MMNVRSLERIIRNFRASGSSIPTLAVIVAAKNGAPTAEQAEEAARRLALSRELCELEFHQEQEQKAWGAFEAHRKQGKPQGKGANGWRAEQSALRAAHSEACGRTRRQKDWEEQQNDIILFHHAHGSLAVLEEALENLFEGLSKDVDGRRQVKAARKVLFPGKPTFRGSPDRANSWREFYNHPGA